MGYELFDPILDSFEMFNFFDATGLTAAIIKHFQNPDFWSFRLNYFGKKFKHVFSNLIQNRN